MAVHGPDWRSASKHERQLQPTEVVQGWADRLRAQISRFRLETQQRMVNNLRLTQEMSCHHSVNRGTSGVGTMLNKDIVARRALTEGISYTNSRTRSFRQMTTLNFRRYGCTFLETGGG